MVNLSLFSKGGKDSSMFLHQSVASSCLVLIPRLTARLPLKGQRLLQILNNKAGSNRDKRGLIILQRRHSFVFLIR